MSALAKITISRRYSLGLEPYVSSLEENGIVNQKCILDVGCGGGMWTLASARLNPNASVIGVDINQKSLDTAERYKNTYGLNNCVFLNMSLYDLLDYFGSNSFHVIICNSVLQYVNTEKALETFSKLLKDDGVLLMFYNHGYGYFVSKLLYGISKFDLLTIMWALKVLVINTVLMRRNDTHPITLDSIKKMAGKVSIVLNQIDNGSFDYLSRIELTPKGLSDDHKYFLGVPYVISFKGLKKA